MTDNELKDECMENAEIDLRRYSNNELTQIREAMRMYADRKLKLFAIPDVMKSVCDDCTAYPFDERGKTPLCKTCKDNPSQTVL